MRYRSWLSILIGMLTTLSLSSGKAAATIDDQMSLVDPAGRTLVIKQNDVVLNGVAPLDRNRLTREWFHSGGATYEVTGPGADHFEGVLELGYQVNFPWVTGVALNFTYFTPNFQPWDWYDQEFGPQRDAYTTAVVPGGSIAVDLENGPGPQDVVTVSAPVKGPIASVRVSNAHGTVTGVAGGVTLRPFARLISASGDEVATYGRIWDMN